MSYLWLLSGIGYLLVFKLVVFYCGVFLWCLLFSNVVVWVYVWVWLGRVEGGIVEVVVYLFGGIDW